MITPVTPLHAVWPSSPPVGGNIDLLMLERALDEVSGETHVAYLSRVLHYAVNRWAYPGSMGQAEAVLLGSGRYEIEPCLELKDRVIRPRRSA